MAVSGVGGTPSVPVTGADSILQLNIAQFLGNIFDQINNDADADKADPTDPTNPARIDETQLAHAFDSLQLPPQVRALGASAVFSQLDPNGTGSVSKPAFVAGLTKLIEDLRAGRVHHHAHVATDPSEASDDDQQPSAWQVISQVLGSNNQAPTDTTTTAAQSDADDRRRRDRLGL
jgi:hypothetical protein